ncbi:hypothetical protein CI610_00501 [invertebrate metagenome]|uniref:Uncharacterized protein n=1 Tax=invertebrate metagenome TaxID=1711999 RepID=A0A2H9TBA8_9ZZZZ
MMIFPRINKNILSVLIFVLFLWFMTVADKAFSVLVFSEEEKNFLTLLSVEDFLGVLKKISNNQWLKCTGSSVFSYLDDMKVFLLENALFLENTSLHNAANNLTCVVGNNPFLPDIAVNMQVFFTYVLHEKKLFDVIDLLYGRYQFSGLVLLIIDQCKNSLVVKPKKVASVFEPKLQPEKVTSLSRSSWVTFDDCNDPVVADGDGMDSYLKDYQENMKKGESNKTGQTIVDKNWKNMSLPVVYDKKNKSDGANKRRLSEDERKKLIDESMNFQQILLRYEGANPEVQGDRICGQNYLSDSLSERSYDMDGIHNFIENAGRWDMLCGCDQQKKDEVTEKDSKNISLDVHKYKGQVGMLVSPALFVVPEHLRVPDANKWNTGNNQEELLLAMLEKKRELMKNMKQEDAFCQNALNLCKEAGELHDLIVSGLPVSNDRVEEMLAQLNNEILIINRSQFNNMSDVILDDQENQWNNFFQYHEINFDGRNLSELHGGYPSLMNYMTPYSFARCVEDDIIAHICTTDGDVLSLSNVLKSYKVSIFQFVHCFEQSEVSKLFKGKLAEDVYLETLEWKLLEKKSVSFAYGLQFVSDNEVLTDINRVFEFSKKMLKRKHSKSLKSRLKSKLINNKEVEEMESQKDKSRRVFCRVCKELCDIFDNNKDAIRIASAKNVLELMNRDTRKCITAVLDEFTFYALHIFRLGDGDNQEFLDDDPLPKKLNEIIRKFQMECYMGMEKKYKGMLQARYRRANNNQIHDIFALKVYCYNQLGVLFDDVDGFSTPDQYGKNLLEDELNTLLVCFNKQFNVEMLKSDKCSLYVELAKALMSDEGLRELMIYFFKGEQPIIAPDLMQKEEILFRVFPKFEKEDSSWIMDPWYFIHLCQSCGLLRHKIKSQ